MANWTADGWAGVGYVLRADGSPARGWHWTADGWIGHFGINIPTKAKGKGSAANAPPGKPRP